MQQIDFDPDELEVAEQWHGGMSSMMYAIASTGALSRGIERCRPRVDCAECGGRGWDYEANALCRACRGARMTDDQWLAYLAGKLESEAEECAEEARTRAKRAGARRRDEQNEMADHAMTLDSIAAKCRAAIAELGGVP